MDTEEQEETCFGGRASPTYSDEGLDSCSYNISGAEKYSSAPASIVKKFQCTECNYSSVYKGDLKTHFDAIHLLKKNYKCDECEYSCYKRSMLMRHVNSIHKQLKNFICTECDYSCFRKDKLQRHVDSVHKQLKKFKCSDCLFFCSENSKLKRHIDNVHKKLKNFMCVECSRSFSRNSVLKRHIETTHNQLKNIKCAECSYSCSRKNKLRIHIDTVHKQAPNELIISNNGIGVDIVKEEMESRCSSEVPELKVFNTDTYALLCTTPIIHECSESLEGGSDHSSKTGTDLVHQITTNDAIGEKEVINNGPSEGIEVGDES